MDSTELARLAQLEIEVAAAEAEVLRLRGENTILADDFRADPTEARRELLRRAASSLSAARDAADSARAALTVFKKTGSAHGLVADKGKVTGTIALLIKPGIDREAREKLVDDALAGPLTEASSALGIVMAASPAKYTRERPGRDAEGRTVLEVAGRVEGDQLVPAISRAAKSLRN